VSRIIPPLAMEDQFSPSSVQRKYTFFCPSPEVRFQGDEDANAKGTDHVDPSFESVQFVDAEVLSAESESMTDEDVVYAAPPWIPTLRLIGRADPEWISNIVSRATRNNFRAISVTEVW
jgi:hypothetical protein